MKRAVKFALLALIMSVSAFAEERGDQRVAQLNDAAANAGDTEPYVLLISERLDELPVVPSAIGQKLTVSSEPARQILAVTPVNPPYQETGASSPGTAGMNGSTRDVPLTASTATPASKKAGSSEAQRKGPTNRAALRRAYVVSLVITEESARQLELQPGDYPANYLVDQKKDGQWGKRTRIVAKVVSSPDGGYSCILHLPRPPAKNSAAAIDFLNGNSIEVASNMLAGKMAGVAPMPKLKKKQYDALRAAYQVKRPWLLSLARFVLPAAPQIATGFMAMGPMGAAMPVTGMVQGLAVRRILGNERQMAVAQNPALHVNYVLADQSEKLGWQDARIAALEHQLKSMEKQIEALKQTKQTTTIQARTERKGRR